MTDRDFEHVTHFPVKLWDVVNDNDCDIFRWSSDGRSFFVDDNKYEQEIMEKYPGFVQISSFANLRRLLREYSFDWQNNDTGEFQFSHPSFQKGERNQIFDIRTKRKSIQVAIGQPVKPRRRSSRHAQNSPNQSKAWIQPVPYGKVNLRVDTLLRFPEKFWAVVNDTNDMLYWGENGDTIVVDDKKYEDGIMTKYPGFVQINSFANLRRLLREYGFSWSIRDNGFFEFSHSHMKKDRPELLNGVKTKRKAMKAGTHHPYLPFFRGDGHFHHQNSAPGTKMYAPVIAHNHEHSEGFEQFEPEINTRSSPEIEQAIGTIQHNQSDARHFHHHHHHHHAEQLAPTNTTAIPAHVYGFHPYRILPAYSPMPTSVALTSPTSWALPTNGEKIDSPFFYPSWSQEGDEETDQTSPTNGTQASSSELRTSSTGSCESVYASTVKGSATDVFHEQLELPIQGEPPASFPIISLQSNEFPSPADLSQNSHRGSSEMSQPNCGDYSTYQTNNSRSTGRVTVPPANVKVEDVAGNAKFIDLSKNENATITNGIRKAIGGEAGDSLQNFGNGAYKDNSNDIAKTSPILEAKDLSIRHQQSKEDHDQSSRSGKRVKHLRSSKKCLKATNVK